MGLWVSILIFTNLSSTCYYPDTLPCYPFQDVDPFIIPEGRLPGLFFTGNQVSSCVDVHMMVHVLGSANVVAVRRTEL